MAQLVICSVNSATAALAVDAINRLLQVWGNHALARFPVVVRVVRMSMERRMARPPKGEDTSSAKSFAAACDPRSNCGLCGMLNGPTCRYPNTPGACF